MAKISNSKGKRWPPNVGENMGRVRFRKKIPVDVELTFGKKHFQEYLPRKQGSSLILEHKFDQSKSRLLAEDPGYIFAMDMARPGSYHR